MAANELTKRLASVYLGEKIRHPKLREVTLAQWLLESGRGTSGLATLHYNFGGLKWRPEMVGYATKIKYEAHDGVDFYCKFATLEGFVNGYWRFLDRAPYSGWEDHASSGEEFIRFIGPIYTPTADYADRVLALVPEAKEILHGVSVPTPAESQSAKSKSTKLKAAKASVADAATALGTIVIDPGHGGTATVGGSSPNNAISVSGVKEKKLTLDFCAILREEIENQATSAGETVKVFLTRTADINIGIKARARHAFNNHAKLFLCLHFNGGAAATRGVETYFRDASNGNNNLNDDIDFATKVQGSLFTSLKAMDAGAKDRGIKPDTQSNPGSLGVLRDSDLTAPGTTPSCRSAYVELEFITNNAVEKLLISGPEAIPNRRRVMADLAGMIRTYMRSF
jgi:N-acetylmuramoyl-L-alanine amidase